MCATNSCYLVMPSAAVLVCPRPWVPGAAGQGEGIQGVCEPQPDGLLDHSDMLHQQNRLNGLACSGCAV